MRYETNLHIDTMILAGQPSGDLFAFFLLTNNRIIDVHVFIIYREHGIDC